MDSADFSQWIQQARAGDEVAAKNLVLHFEPVLRRQMRMMLTDPWMKRIYDMSDLMQSVFGNFFIRLAAGQFDLEHPAQVAKLLNTMAVNRIRNLARSPKTKNRRELPGELVDGLASPSSIVAREDLLLRVRDLLSEEEKTLAELRTAGLSWEEVALQIGGLAEARRKQFTRAMDRVARQFQWEELGETQF